MTIITPLLKAQSSQNDQVHAEWYWSVICICSYSTIAIALKVLYYITRKRIVNPYQHLTNTFHGGIIEQCTTSYRSNCMEQSPSWEANSHSASQEISAFHGTWRFITVFIRARHWPLSWARCILFTPSHTVTLRFILILSSHLCPGLPCSVFPSDTSKGKR
jgi:hypothetical protein